MPKIPSEIKDYVEVNENAISLDNDEDINAEIREKYNKGLKLSAPVKGKMSKDIFENISTSVTVTLKKEKEIIFSDTSNMCGLEIVQK